MDKEPLSSAQTVIVTPPLVVGPEPSKITCPICHNRITTTVELENSTMTHMMAILLGLIFCPCAFIPYCTDSCKSKNHYCPKCRAFIGSYRN